MSFWNETLRPKGKYELKRVMAVQSFNFAILYAFMPFFDKTFKSDPMIFFSLLAFGGTCIGIALQEKIKIGEPQPPIESSLTENQL
jgi:hypothetical protein